MTNASTRPPPKTNPALHGRPWDVDQVRQVLNGSAEPTLLNGFDRKGMTSSQFALLRTAVAADQLLGLMTLLDPPTATEQTQLDQVLSLLETIAESQIRIEARLAALESAISGPRVNSPQPSRTGRTVSRG